MEPTNLIAEEGENIPLGSSKEPIVEISVIIPISERYDDLERLYFEYGRELKTDGHSFEFIFVLDGPDHKALNKLKSLKKDYQNIKIITLNRTFGEATALSVGFGQAQGPIIVTLSSYIQVEAQEINRMLSRLIDEGVDLVISKRYPRIDSQFNQFQSWVFHWITRLLTGTKYRDISCGLRVMKRKVVEEVHLYGDMHRFFPLLAYQKGFKVLELSVRQSKYDVNRRIYTPGTYLRRLLDILTLFFLFKFTKKPLRFFGLVGSGLLGFGFLITGYLGLYRLLEFGPIANRPLLIFGVILIVMGIQLFSIGLLGEIIIFTHARKIKDYNIEKVLE